MVVPLPTRLERALDRRKDRVLLAEDDEALRNLLARVLRNRGYEVVAVADGAALVDVLGTALIGFFRIRRPDVIVSDVQLPFVTGIEALARLRRQRWNTPVILMSGDRDPAARAEAERLGIVAWLEKPFAVEHLLSLLDGIAHLECRKDRSCS